eukprot:5808533-Amphidinium_carterae.1
MSAAQWQRCDISSAQAAMPSTSFRSEKDEQKDQAQASCMDIAHPLKVWQKPGFEQRATERGPVLHGHSGGWSDNSDTPVALPTAATSHGGHGLSNDSGHGLCHGVCLKSEEWPFCPSAEVIGLSMQLQEDVHLLWQMYFADLTPNLAAQSSVDLAQLFMQLHVKTTWPNCTMGSGAASMPILLQLLMHVRDELDRSGVMQAVYCPEALLTMYPKTIFSHSLLTHQALSRFALLHLHNLLASAQSGHAPQALREPCARRLCEYAACAGCVGWAWKLEQTKVHALQRVAVEAAAASRKLVVLFASQHLLDAAWRCLAGGMPAVCVHAGILATQLPQLIRQSSCLLVHESVLEVGKDAGLGEIIGQGEAQRLLERCCYVLAYQPVTCGSVVVNGHLVTSCGAARAESIPGSIDVSAGYGASTHRSQQSAARNRCCQHPKVSDQEEMAFVQSDKPQRKTLMTIHEEVPCAQKWLHT